MKTLLCPKGGEIHPSPAEDPIRAAFRLLPAAILVLVAGMGPEDREILAYLVTRPSVQEAAVAGHPPTHGCGCFDCYISFWSRWDRSPERDRILDAVQAFEDHLAASKRRDRGRKRRSSTRLPATPLVEVVVREPASPPCAPPPHAPASKGVVVEEDNVASPEPPGAEEKRSADEESKRGWAADVLGRVLATLRLWGIWSPSAT